MNINKLTLFGFLLITLSIVSADPQITTINIPNEIYYGEITDLNVIFDAEGQTGTINFWDNESIIEQRNFSSGTTMLSFQKTWTNIGDRNISFSLTDLNGTDTNSLNNIKSAKITVAKGIDFIVSSISTEPETLLPTQNTIIKAFIQNVGDTNFVGETTATFYFDANEIGEVAMLNLDVGETKTIELEYEITESFVGEATIMVQINKLHTINEFDTTNNSRVLDVTEEGSINLKINSVSTEGNIKMGELTEFSVAVENNGGQPAEDIVIGVYKTVISNDTRIGEYRIANLNAHTIQNISFSTFFATPGEDTIFVFVDPFNDIPEFNENDNDFSLDLNVQENNIDLSLGEYLSTLEVLENEINDCQSDLKSSRLERDVALDSVANLTTERNNCESNLNSCNQNSATFMVEELDKIRETTQNDTNITQTYYFEQLVKKDEDIRTIKEDADKRVKQAEEYAMIGYAAALLLIIIFVGNYLFTLQKKRTERIDV